MTKRSTLLPLLGAAALMCSPDARACGDKFLVVGKGVRYSRARAVHPASILIYMNPTSRMPAAAKDVQLEARLLQAGHKVRKVDSAGQLDQALKSKRYDLVLGDIKDSPGLEKQVADEPSGPVVVPVLYRPTAAELATAKNQYGCAMNAPSKDPLSAIDEAMAQRVKSSAAKPSQAQ